MIFVLGCFVWFFFWCGEGNGRLVELGEMIGDFFYLLVDGVFFFGIIFLWLVEENMIVNI